ncbi:BTAD domain-containing putative transcriptional regulator [Micromonospora chalcea]
MPGHPQPEMALPAIDGCGTLQHTVNGGDMHISKTTLKLLGHVRVGQINSRPWETTMVRGLISALVANQGTMVSTYRLLNWLWDEPPASAEANIRSYATKLRRSLVDSTSNLRLVTYRGNGYALEFDEADLDVNEFKKLRMAGQQLKARGDLTAAAHTMRAALSLWQGRAGDDLPKTVSMSMHADGLNLDWLSTTEELAEIEFQIGDLDVMVARLMNLLATDPARDRGWALLVRGQNLIGGHSCAVQLVQKARVVLAQTTGSTQHPHTDYAARQLSSRRPV